MFILKQFFKFVLRVKVISLIYLNNFFLKDITNYYGSLKSMFKKYLKNCIMNDCSYHIIMSYNINNNYNNILQTNNYS